MSQIWASKEERGPRQAQERDRDSFDRSQKYSKTDANDKENIAS